MAEAHKKHLGTGIVLAISFIVVLVLIFSPIFPKTPEGNSQNGLDFADRMFNELSKGSSYFIPKIKKDNEKFIGKTFAVSIKIDKPEDAENTIKLFNSAGARAEMQGTEMKIEGDLGKVVETVLNDSDAMYNNDGSKVSGLYGYAEKAVMKNWWQALSKMAKTFTKDKKLDEAKLLDSVNKKAVETSYNFYGITAQKVSENAVLMTGLLVFYVVYTMWWGFAIFFIFEGIGLTMKKSKVKKEV
ncbi:MAG: hypothetical protein HZA10_07770 [Nitrospirae bacterium]|nr:hypothetical protein [Nitrospirota bacterium]